jgi:hypothetical protein
MNKLLTQIALHSNVRHDAVMTRMTGGRAVRSKSGDLHGPRPVARRSQLPLSAAPARVARSTAALPREISEVEGNKLVILTGMLNRTQVYAVGTTC